MILLLVVLVSVSLWCWWLMIIKKGSGHVLSGCLPIIGHTYKVLGDTGKLWAYIEDISKESAANGGVSRMILAMQTFYVITDPQDITTVGNSCLQKHFSYDFVKSWLGDGMITAPIPVWKRHRKLLNPAFTLQLLHGFLNIFNVQARELVDDLAVVLDKGSIDISSYIRENAMNTLCQTALGITTYEETGLFQKYIDAADQILEMIVTRFQNFWIHSNLVYRLVGLKKKEADLIKVLNEMSNTVIRKKRSEMDNVSDVPKVAATSGLKHKAFLDLLLDLSAENTLTDKEIREEVDTIIIAGTDTFSWLSTYTCAYLGTYPEVQEKVMDELTEIFGDSDRDVDKDDLKRMVYTEAVIKETLRLHPIIPLSLRTVQSGVKLRNQYLRPGEHIIMSFYGVNRHPMWGPDADQFRPERWLEPDTLPAVYGGFGIGKRGCIGKTYAMILMKTFLAHMLRRYRIFGDVTKLKIKMDFISKPVSGHFVSLSERNKISA